MIKTKEPQYPKRVRNELRFRELTVLRVERVGAAFQAVQHIVQNRLPCGVDMVDGGQQRHGVLLRAGDDFGIGRRNVDKGGSLVLRIHDLRHSFASLAVNSGATLYEVQDLLGHSTSQMTQRYAHLADTGRVRVVGRVAEMVRTAVVNSSNAVH